MFERYCISCGEPYQASREDILFCPNCGGPAVAPSDALPDFTRLSDRSAPLPAQSGPPLPDDTWQVGDLILDVYQVKQIFTGGGMGLVYRVHHRNWGIDLALKSPRPEIIARFGEEDFIREANTWVELGLHPYIVTCYYVRKIAGFPRIFAEYVEGGSLRDWIDDRRLYAGGQAHALARVLDIAIQFAWGLAYAHDQRLVHRDIKPANVLMTPAGIAKVTDFGLVMDRGGNGIARWVEPIVGPEASKLVRMRDGKEIEFMDKAGMMTPAYCSPEQKARLPLTLKTDLWSWAVSIFEMFSGEVTWYNGAAAGEALAEYLQNGPVNPLIGPMPEPVAQLLGECFRLNPEQRPADFLEIANRLQEIYPGLVGESYPRQQPQAAELRADSLSNKALSLWDLGSDLPLRREEAKKLWQEALSLEPNHPESTYNLGLVEWHANQILDSTVVERMSEVCNSRPGDWRSHCLMAQVHLERDDCQAALVKLAAIDPKDVGRPEVVALREQAQDRLEESTRLEVSYEDHQDVINAVCLSEEGWLALSASRDRTIKLWDTISNTCLKSLTDETQGGVTSAWLSRDGRLAVSVNWNELKVWDLQAGRILRKLVGHDKLVHSVRISFDGKLILSGGEDKVLKLWDIQTGQCLNTYGAHERAIISARLSKDDRYALSGSEDGVMKLWDLHTGQCRRTIQDERLASCALSQDGRYAASGGWKFIHLWDLVSGECLKTFPESDRVHSISISSDDSLIFAGLNRVIHVWDVLSGRCLRTLEGHTYLVQALDLTQDGRTLLSGCMDRTVKLWAINPELGKMEAPLAVAGIAAVEKALSGTSNYTQALSQARQQAKSGNYHQAAIHLRTARSQSGFERDRAALEEWTALYRRLPRGKLSAAWCVQTLEGHESLVSSVCLSPEGKLGFTGGYDKQIRIWDLDNGQCVRALQGHHNDIKSISISPDGQKLLTGSFDHTLKLWDIESGSCLKTFTGHRDYITSVSWSREGRFALSCAGSYDPTVRLWDVESGFCLRVLKGHTGNVNAVSISEEGRFGLSGGDHGILKYWDLASGACLADWSFKGTIKSVCLGLDSQTALVGNGYSAVLWDLRAGMSLQEFSGHDSYVFAVQLSLDGRYAFTGSLDHTMKMWDTQTGACLRTFEGQHSEVNSIAISPDNALVFTSGGWDKTAKLWFLDWELESPPRSNWDPGALPYLEAFLNRQRPPAGALPLDRQPSEVEIAAALTRQGRPTWTDVEFQALLDELGFAGYGWLSSGVVRKKLVELEKSTEAKNGA